MAYLKKRNGTNRVRFSFDNKNYSRSLKTCDAQKVKLAMCQIERILELVSLGLLSTPCESDVFDFFLTGKVQAMPAERGSKPLKKQTDTWLSLEKMFDLYIAAFLRESLKESSYGTLQTYRNNLQR